jgi:hypothetical protein
MQPGHHRGPAPTQPQDCAVPTEPLRPERPAIRHLQQMARVRRKIDALGKRPSTSCSDHLAVRVDEHARAATAGDFRLPELAQPRRALELLDRQLKLIGPGTKRLVGHHTLSRCGTRETFLLVPNPLRATLSRTRAPQRDQLGGGQVTSASRSDGKGQLQRRQVGLVGDRPGTMILRRAAGPETLLRSTSPATSSAATDRTPPTQASSATPPSIRGSRAWTPCKPPTRGPWPRAGRESTASSRTSRSGSRPAPHELDLVSRRVGNYRYDPVSGCCSTSSGFASWRG